MVLKIHKEEEHQARFKLKIKGIFKLTIGVRWTKHYWNPWQKIELWDLHSSTIDVFDSQVLQEISRYYWREICIRNNRFSQRTLSNMTWAISARAHVSLTPPTLTYTSRSSYLAHIVRRKHFNVHGLLINREVRMAGCRGYQPSSLFWVFMDRDEVERVHKHAKKKKANIQPSWPTKFGQ